MADDQQVPTRRDGLGQAPDHVDHAAVRRVQVLGGDEVEGAVVGVELTGVDLPPVGPLGHTRLLGESRRPRQARGGEVGAGDLPTAAGQP
jgi:hypothetical protein